MVGTMPTRVTPRQNKPTTENVPVVEENHGDGPWVQPASEVVITSQGVTVDPSVLETIIQNRRASQSPTAATRTEKSPNPSSTVASRRKIKDSSRAQVRASTPKTSTSVKTTNASPGTAHSPSVNAEIDASRKADIAQNSKGAVDQGSKQAFTPGLVANCNSEVALKKGEAKKETVLRQEETVMEEVAIQSSTPAPRFGLEATQLPPERRVTAVLGRDLYLRFLHEEMQNVHVREPPNMDPWREARLDVEYSQIQTASVPVRKSLRHVADSFAASEQRELVRQRAANVDIMALDCAAFHNMLATLFQEDKVTSERVVVLFFFCADLTIRALSEKLTHCFHQLIEWTQVYIVDTFSVWVQQNGGWSAILDDSANFACTAAKIGVACLAVAALVVLVRRAR